MSPRRRRLGGAGALALLCASVAACASRGALWDPPPGLVTPPAPDSFVVLLETSEGPIEVLMQRAWSPLAVDRAYHLTRNDFYAGARIHRVEPGFVVQFGLTGDPLLDSIWTSETVPDEPVLESNRRGVVSFARSGPNTRAIQLFINLVDNRRLDTVAVGGVRGYPPIGRITSGLEVVDGFYSAYRPDPPRQDSIRAFGNGYLRRHYPQLDSIIGTRILREWE